VGNPSRRDGISLNPQVMLQAFDKWEIDFVGPINPSIRRSGESYIITVTRYLTRWEDVASVIGCISENVAQFLFENVVTLFGFVCILLSD
jgi:hypothetical protein